MSASTTLGAPARPDHLAPDPLSEFCRYRDTKDPALRERLIEAALPLAHQVARRYRHSHESLDDVIQVARLGLVKAVDRFDPSRGVAFSTYAVPTMVGEIKRYFRDTGWAVHVPRSLQERVQKVEKVRSRLADVLGRSPTVDEIADEAELSVEEVLQAMEAAAAYDARSLDAPAPDPDDDAPSYADTLGTADDGYELVEDRGAVHAALKVLPMRERRILHMRFAGDMTQAEIAAQVGVSQMQVSRLLRRSLRALREEADGQS
jgi:RNA polymerase sigma-B factor